MEPVPLTLQATLPVWLEFCAAPFVCDEFSASEIVPLASLPVAFPEAVAPTLPLFAGSFTKLPAADVPPSPSSVLAFAFPVELACAPLAEAEFPPSVSSPALPVAVDSTVQLV
jgi:hypothetical protein